ncbi:hypothetical protein IKG20_02485 [Candidatus Saccharibacteria bacterium]|nr:hypothetical protein [Candidatus Saccharibacteria bacterium]
MATNPSRIKTFYKEHRSIAIGLILGILAIIILIIVITISSSDNDGVEGTDSRDYSASTDADLKAIKDNESFGIANMLPISSADPSYQISYLLTTDETGNYSFRLTLSALSASGREAMVKQFLTTNFSPYDPLDYEIDILNYYNPFTPFSLEDISDGNFPENFSKGTLYHFGDSPYTAQTLIHTLYDGSTNTYRYVLKDGKPIIMPKLFFTYKELSFLDKSDVRSINALE